MRCVFLLSVALAGCAASPPRDQPPALNVTAGIGIGGIAITSQAGRLTKCDVTARDTSGSEWLTRDGFSIGPAATVDLNWRQFTASNDEPIPAYLGNGSRFTISCLDDEGVRREATLGKADR